MQFTEAAMFMVLTGNRAGKYVAGCARDACGYEANLDDGYKSSYMRLGRYPKRGKFS